jgi:hypothetical protein
MKAVTLIGFVNEISIGEDGWAMVAPVGDFESWALFRDEEGRVKKQRAIQRYDAEGIGKMVASFHNSRRGLKKYLTGLPIYVGHPDVPGLEKNYPDKEPKGVFADLQARATGLFGLPVFTNEGGDLVERKVYRAFSGNTGNSEPAGEKEVNGKMLPVFRPTELFSAGLTNTPHLPVEFLNEAEGNDAEAADIQNTMNKKAVIALFTSLGIMTSKGVAFANDASDEEVAEGLKHLGEKAKEAVTFANEKARLEGQVTTLQGEVNGHKSTIQSLTTERDTARTQFANERASRIEDLLGAAVAAGRITEAERPTWKGRLEHQAQFTNELAALQGLEPKVKTQAASAGRSDKSKEPATAQERRQFINEAIENVCREKGWDPKKDYGQAFNHVQRTHAALFANMKQPGKKS